MENEVIHLSEKIHLFILSYVKIPSLAEDLRQDVLVKLLQNKQRLLSITDLDNYALKIAKHTIIDHFKKMKKDEHLKQNVYQMMQTKNQNFITKIYEKQFESEVLRIIESLPEKQAKVFKLFFIDGLKKEEIAKELKISSNTVKNHLIVARKKVKNKLNHDYHALISLSGIIMWIIS